MKLYLIKYELLQLQDSESSFSSGPMSPSRLLMETSKLAEKVKLQKLIEDSAEANLRGTSVRMGINV